MHVDSVAIASIYTTHPLVDKIDFGTAIAGTWALCLTDSEIARIALLNWRSHE